MRTRTVCKCGQKIILTLTGADIIIGSSIRCSKCKALITNIGNASTVEHPVPVWGVQTQEEEILHNGWTLGGWPVVSKERLKELHGNRAFVTKSEKNGEYRLWWDERSGGVYCKEDD